MMTAGKEKEIQQLQKRIRELSEKARLHNIYTHTGFLSIAEQDLIYGMSRELTGVPWTLYGGREDCERRILRFGSEEAFGYEEAFPIVCLKAAPLQEKFSDTFTHRDFLGAVMNLGIDRSTVGDIFLVEKTAYLFCTEKIAPFIEENLRQVKHTRVVCAPAGPVEQLPVKEPDPVSFTVTSERADVIIAKVYNLSRNQSLSLFRERKIYINGRLDENNSDALKDGAVVSVRGYGKFVYYGASYETKKGKKNVSAGIYR